MLFYATLLAGIALVLASDTWFSAWLGLEINLLSFTPVILLSAPRGSESGLKYFLVQAVASLILLQISFSWFILPLSSLFLMIPLIMKLGMAPLHFWLPDVVSSMSWSTNMILLTIQKLAPLYLLAVAATLHNLVLMMIGVISTMAGALGGLNETDTRKLMAFSSISHMGWMAVGISLPSLSSLLYVLAYMVLATSTMTLLKKNSITQLSQLTSKDKNTALVMAMFLSMGGFPPLLGFAPKWAILSETLDVSLMAAIMLIATSIVTLYYYIRAGLATLTFIGPTYKLTPPRTSLLHFMLALMNILGGGAYMFMWSSLVL
uniref:NADH-ubiquinone oxidoreductase chain 2 n=1 Tax=Proasellus parvulus TaxID=1282015 RepID=A0A485MEX8_9CRUS|nr:NADH dehydrogenase subunit 2 [Proasellus parvulus]